jgi:REP element-mobilizing transposase RayT
MANTYTQIYIHVVFAVSARACVIRPECKEQIQKYIGGIVRRRNQKLIAINCMPDHAHVLLGLKPDDSVSDLVGKIKTGSTNHINTQRLIGCRFSWQEGFGAFSVSQSHLNGVIRYIQNQEEHHRRKTFHEEYLEFLNRHDIPFDKRYVFKLID